MLRAERLYKNFGALEVTQNVSINVDTGMRHAIIGPNGAGKTTLFNLLAGELKPLSGTIFLDGRDVTSLPPNRRARLGLSRSYQRSNVFAGLTVRENLLLADIAKSGRGCVFWEDVFSQRAPARMVEEVAELVGLAGDLDRIVSHLAYGSVRQLEIGLALATQPRVLLLDEPTSGMSPEESERMLSLVGELPRELAVLIIEHDMDMIFETADRITVLNYGQVLMEGTPEEVRASSAVRETYLGGNF